MKRVLQVLSGLLLLTVLALFFLPRKKSPQDSMPFKSDQPATVHYQSHDPYEVRATGGPRTSPYIGSHQMTQIDISPSVDMDRGYEMLIDVPDAKIVGADWSSAGVDLRFSSGHRLFVPKDAFIGGR